MRSSSNTDATVPEYANQVQCCSACGFPVSSRDAFSSPQSIKLRRFCWKDTSCQSCCEVCAPRVQLWMPLLKHFRQKTPEGFLFRKQADGWPSQTKWSILQDILMRLCLPPSETDVVERKNLGKETTACLSIDIICFFVWRWTAVATWRWVANDDSCGICRMPFDGCCSDCKLPGDDCPLGETFFLCNLWIHSGHHSSGFFCL